MSLDQSEEEFYYLKLEALWILIVFSGVAQDEDLKLVFQSSFDKSNPVVDDGCMYETGITLLLEKEFYQ